MVERRREHAHRRRRWRSCRGALLATALLAASHPAAADSMRCGSKLISDGDPVEKLLQYCGEPASRTRTWIVRQPHYELGGRDYPFPGEEDVPVDVWVYDFGPNKLMRKVRMVAGKIESIETLEHGTPR